MPNLDAEVLNEPKKQIVKDFNKEEIVQIVQNAIDKGIINLGDIGGSEVVANPTLEGTEPNLEGLEVDGEKYKIPEGTVVEANPTLAGTEDALTGLQVGDTKYKVGGGAKLYLCKKTYSVSNNSNLINCYLYVSLYSSKQLTEDEFVSKYADWDIRVRYQYGTDTINGDKACGRQLNTISSVTKTSLIASFNYAKIVDGALANGYIGTNPMSSNNYECKEV